MEAAPIPHPLDLVRSTKMLPVFRLIAPSSLRGHFARFAAFRLRAAILLSSSIVGQRLEKLVTVAAFTRSVRIHGGGETPRF